MTITSMMLAPLANASFSCTSGQSYLSNSVNVITGIISTADQTDLLNQGCAILTPTPTNLLFKLLAANFNTTADQLVTPYFIAKYRITKITALNTTVNGMSTAAGGFYTGAGKTGTTIVAAGQVYTGLTNAATALDLTLNAPTAVLVAGTPLYFSLSPGQGAAAKADIYVWGDTYN